MLVQGSSEPFGVGGAGLMALQWNQMCFSLSVAGGTCQAGCQLLVMVVEGGGVEGMICSFLRRVSTC